ncbi:Serine phosphatase RsbU [Flammeovirgaceae bacterium 311]|nr:Serine phosphatase RsbU [Flammeovirgaceae bacterium 311]
MQAGFMLALLLVAIEMYTTYSSLQEYSAENKEIIATYELLHASEQLISTLKDAQTSQRGYILTQNSDFLEPFNEANKQVPELIQQLKGLTLHYHDQQKSLAGIEQRVVRLQAYLHESISISRYKSHEEAIQLVKQESGKSLMDSLRTDVRQLETAFKNLLHDQKTVTSTARLQASMYGMSGGFISILLLFITYVSLRSMLSKEELLAKGLGAEVQKQTEELHAANEELLAGNEELTAYVDNLNTTQEELERQQARLQEAYKQLESENARKSAELEEARELQLSMLPDAPPALPHLDLKLYLESASEVGGDYYDYRVDAEGNFTFAIGDVTGHGLRAGILVATAKSYFQNIWDQSGEFILQKTSAGIRGLKLRGMYMGMMVLQQKGNCFTVTGAGMPPLLHFKKADGHVEIIKLPGMFLGFHEQQRFCETQLQLQEGDILLALTDGLLESKDPAREALGIQRVAEKLKELTHLTTADICEQLIQYGKAWINDPSGFRDDLSMIILKGK